MILRLHAPPVRPAVDLAPRKSWLPRGLRRRGTATTTASSGSSGSGNRRMGFTAAHREAAEAMVRAEQAKQADGLYDEEFDGPAPRKRPTARSTRRTQRRTEASTTAEWDEEDETWPEEDAQEEEKEKEAELQRKRRIVMPEPLVGSPRGNPRPWVRAGHRWTRGKPDLDEAWPSDEA